MKERFHLGGDRAGMLDVWTLVAARWRLVERELGLAEAAYPVEWQA